MTQTKPETRPEHHVVMVLAGGMGWRWANPPYSLST
jgi:hypothetical protein